MKLRGENFGGLNDHRHFKVPSGENAAKTIIERIHPSAQKLLSNPSFCIESSSFFDLYGQENVVADMRKVKAMRSVFANRDTKEDINNHKIGDVFEALVLRHTNSAGWFGDKVKVLKTTLYDDYFNHTDMVAEWEETDRESTLLALGVDVTSDKTKIYNKLHEMRKMIDQGKLGKIKYFKSRSSRGERSNVPHAVIGVEARIIRDVAVLWAAGDQKALEKHPIQRILIEELASQMKTMRDYARANGRVQAQEAYDRSLSIIEEIRLQKQDIPLPIVEDRVHREILSQAETVFRT